jgi:hypothetical protein
VQVLELVSAQVLELVLAQAWAQVLARAWAQVLAQVWVQVSEPKILGSRILGWQNSRRVPTDNPF